MSCGDRLTSGRSSTSEAHYYDNVIGDMEKLDPKQ